MRQKLLIAIALSSGATLLVLDEPTGSLDPRSRDRFFELFAELEPDTTLLLCSHRLEEIVPLVDHVLALDEGRVAYHGSAGAFLDARASSVLELRVRGEAAAALLAERGFRRGGPGWWLRTVPRGEKSRLLTELATALGAAIEDLNVRDLEALDLAPGGERREDADG
jgi:ABC-type multidrug transport system ATPase subunit